MIDSYLLINPKAGMLKGCTEPKEIKAKLDGLKLDPKIFIAKGGVGINNFIKAVKKDKPKVVLIAGGDGTTATVLKALRKAPVTFGLIPTGSTNNIGQSIGLSGNSLEEAIDVINKGRTAKMDIGKVNGKIFVESVGIGLLANIMATVGEQDSKKEVIKVMRHTLKEVVVAEPIPVSVWADERELAFDTVWLTVTNTGRAAAAVIDPTSKVTDKKIELVYCEPLTVRELSRYALAFLRNSHLKQKKFKHLRAKILHLTLPPGTDVHIDGKLIKAPRLQIEVVPAALEVFVP